jgi:hypothetical protein
MHAHALHSDESMARRPESDNTVHIGNIAAFHHYFLNYRAISQQPFPPLFCSILFHPVTSTPPASPPVRVCEDALKLANHQLAFTHDSLLETATTDGATQS